MASNYWIKLYHEILDDPKMGQLPDYLWRRAIELFLMAGEMDEAGKLPSVADMAWKLRISIGNMIEDLTLLAADGIEIVTELSQVHHASGDEGSDETSQVRHASGDWMVTNFEKRQAAMTGSERMERLRDAKRKDNYYGDEDVTKRHASSDEDVTKAQTDTDTEVDTDTDTETDKIQTTDKEAEKTKTAVAVKILLADFGVEEPGLSDLASTCPEQTVKDWIAYVNGRDDIRHPAGFLFSQLRIGKSPPVEKEKERWFTGDDFKKYFVQPGELPEEEM